MTNNNTMSKGEYVFDHIFWGIISMIWFNNVLFRNIERLTFVQSRLFLWLSVIISIAAGVTLTWKKRRNKLSLFVNIVMPYELYSFIAYRNTAPILAWSGLAVSLLLSFSYVILILKPKIRTRARRESVIRARAIRSFLGTRTVVACCLSILHHGINRGSSIYSDCRLSKTDIEYALPEHLSDIDDIITAIAIAKYKLQHAFPEDQYEETNAKVKYDDLPGQITI